MNVDQILSGWQKSRHVIGMVEFLTSDSVLRKFVHNIGAEYIPIGMCEAEALCVNRESGEIVLLEHEVSGKIFCKASKDQSHFVFAMKKLEAHFAKCGEDDAYYDDIEVAKQIRDECAKLAGGNDYEGFYSSLIGV